MSNVNTPYLDAVVSRIGSAILDFCSERVGQEFYADDLRRFVIHKVGLCAPGSADRVLRDLRQRGAINYVCVSRSKSLYFLHSANPVFDLL
jgi:hypothetical protein